MGISNSNYAVYWSASLLLVGTDLNSKNVLETQAHTTDQNVDWPCPKEGLENKRGVITV